MSAPALRPEFWASVSGGKDSLFMLKLILDHPEEYPLNGVVHYELEIDYPFIHDVIDYMESECKRYGIQFWRIRPRKTWAELLEKHGFPTKRARWCNSEYKLDGDRQLREWLKSKGVRPVMYIGFCADEEKRFKAELFDRDARYIYPLAEHDIEEATILEWAKTVPIFNDFYKMQRRCGCMWCPLQSYGASAYTREKYPEEWAKIAAAARKRERELSEQYGHQVSVWDGRGKYDTDYREAKLDKIAEKMHTQQMTISEYMAGKEGTE